MKQTLYKHKNIISRLLSQPNYRNILFHTNTQVEGITSPKNFPLYKVHIFIVVIIIWNRSDFRRELQVEVEKYTLPTE